MSIALPSGFIVTDSKKLIMLVKPACLSVNLSLSNLYVSKYSSLIPDQRSYVLFQFIRQVYRYAVISLIPELKNIFRDDLLCLPKPFYICYFQEKKEYLSHILYLPSCLKHFISSHYNFLIFFLNPLKHSLKSLFYYFCCHQLYIFCLQDIVLFLACFFGLSDKHKRIPLFLRGFLRLTLRPVNTLHVSFFLIMGLLKSLYRANASSH